MADTGWTNFGGQSRKWHYIGEDGRSLCGKWAAWTRGPFEQGMDESPDNCAACRRRLAKRKAVGESPSGD